MAGDGKDSHYALVTRALAEGRVVPFLGAGAALCGRPEHSGFKQGEFLPSGAELTDYLAENYPKGEPKDLLRVAQFVYVMEGSGPLLRPPASPVRRQLSGRRACTACWLRFLRRLRARAMRLRTCW